MSQLVSQHPEPQMAVNGESGYVFKDSGTTPPAVAETTTSCDQLKPPSSTIHQPGLTQTCNEKANSMINNVQDEFIKIFEAESHDLARRDNGIKGTEQIQPILEFGSDVTSLGWRNNLADMPNPLITNISNGRLFSLIRRFNKDVFDVRAVPAAKVTGLDLTEAWDKDHATDKMTLHLQRAYLTVVLGMASFGKQISRLRSWKETTRTTVFCATYFLAWVFDLLMPLVLGMLLVIIGSKTARETLFPSAPLALVNIGTGGLQKPKAGQLGTTDTLTGALEKAEGEAREEEAANFIKNLRHILSHAVGMHDSKGNEGDPLEGKVPKPVRNVIKSIKAAGSAPGHATEHSGKDMTEEPMEELLWDKVKPKVIEPVIEMAPHVIGEIVDNWERFANAISPLPPFSRLSFARINAVLAPLFLVSLFVSQYMVYKVTSFAIGFGLFGDPIISRTLKWIDKKYPSWMEMLEPKNNILRGVPTNSQLTLTLLRMGEAHGSPIPPVPRTKPSDVNKDPNVSFNQIPLKVSRHEVEQAVQPSSKASEHDGHSSPPNTGNQADNEKGDPKHRHLSKVIMFFKGNSKSVVNTKLAVDHIRAATGSNEARGRLGVLQEQKNLTYAGPSSFKARFNGEKGWLHIKSSATSTTTDSTKPHLIFTTEDPRYHDIDLSNKDKFLWSIAVDDIHRLKRASAFVSKPIEKAVDLSGDTELLSSLEIVDEREKTWQFTAIPERDELFNRLIALGKQRWENM